MSILWRQLPGGDHESHDWRFLLSHGGDNLYDVRDYVEETWIAHGLTLEKAKQACEDVLASEQQLGT